MNDPGLDDPINESDRKIEDERKEEEDVEREDEQAFLNPRFLPHENVGDPWFILTPLKQSMVVRLNGLSFACSTCTQCPKSIER